MRKVMIVDDERLIREGLQRLIDWESMGFTIVALAQDAEDAIANFRKHDPDLVLMDIKLPGMDGLALIQELKKIKPATRFIILSGHTDFEYTKQAIHLKIDAYLQKTVDEDELLECLKEISSSLESAGVSNDRSRVQTASLEGKMTPLPELEPYLKTAISMGAGSEVHRNSCSILEKNLSWQTWQVFVLELRQILPGNGDLQGIHRVLEDDFASRKAGLVTQVDSCMILVLPQEHVNQKHLVQLYRHVESRLKSLCREFFMACGNPVSRAEDMHESYRQARERMKFRFFCQPGTVINQIPRKKENQGHPASDDIPGLAEQLYLAVHSGNENRVIQLLDEAVEAWVGTEEGENLIKSLWVRLLSSAMNRLVASNTLVWGNNADCFDWISACWEKTSMDELKSWIVENLLMVMDQDSGDGSLGLVRKITDLVRKNYFKNLKLETLSEVFSYNSAYLGKLFKHHMGESFHCYLDKVRIEKAKELLAQGMKVYVVAERVGYAYVDYFHGKFRKYTGMSPSDWRKSSGQQDPEQPDPDAGGSQDKTADGTVAEGALIETGQE